MNGGSSKSGTQLPPRRPASSTESARRRAASLEETASRRKAASGAVTSAAAGTARSMFKNALLDRRPYLKYAFSNPYNLSLLLGTIAAAGITLNPILAAAAIGLEALWLLWAPDSKRLRHILWDPRFEKLRSAIEADELAKRIAEFDPVSRERVEALVGQREMIRDLAARNPSFTGDLLRGELVKTDRLVDAFVEMASNCTRYEDYLASVDMRTLESERERWERAVRSGKNGDPETELAKKNFAILIKRSEKMTEIRRYLQLARGQLDLIENSFQLIADQIVTMQSPQQLSGQLDELLDGVEAIRESAVDTQKLLDSFEV